MRVSDRLSEFDYVLKCDQDNPVEEQTTFTLKGLPYDTDVALRRREAKSRVEIPGAGKAMGKGEKAWNKAMESSSMVMLMDGAQIELEFEILKVGLVKVENLIGADEYPGENASDTNKKKWFSRWLDPKYRTELANTITEHSALSEEEVKN